MRYWARLIGAILLIGGLIAIAILLVNLGGIVNAYSAHCANHFYGSFAKQVEIRAVGDAIRDLSFYTRDLSRAWILCSTVSFICGWILLSSGIKCPIGTLAWFAKTTSLIILICSIFWFPGLILNIHKHTTQASYLPMMDYYKGEWGVEVFTRSYALKALHSFGHKMVWHIRPSLIRMVISLALCGWFMMISLGLQRRNEKAIHQESEHG